MQAPQPPTIVQVQALKLFIDGLVRVLRVGSTAKRMSLVEANGNFGKSCTRVVYRREVPSTCAKLIIPTTSSSKDSCRAGECNPDKKQVQH